VPSEELRSPARSEDRAEAAQRTMRALTDADDVFEVFFERAEIGLGLVGLDGSYVRVNPTYATLLGATPEDLVGEPLRDRLDEHAADELLDVLAGRRSTASSEQRVGPSGAERWVLHGVATVPGADGRPAWLAVSAQDITERRRAESELRSLTAALTERAVRDPLTGLANRALLQERLRAALARDARTGGSTGVLFLDLDGFKLVNDRHGHRVGDAVLVTVAQRLSAVVRPSDTVARLGGDEFVVLVEGAGGGDLPELVARLRHAVADPVQVRDDDGRTLDLSVGVSVGEAVSRAGEDDPDGLVARADAAMYAAKHASRERGGASDPYPPGRVGAAGGHERRARR
jgi:diguanylate cyclase (GGDEF)-like protein/PAS domain S-box-containing protein